MNENVIQSAPATVVRSFFFFQAEDGIRDLTVTGVQTCALPILFGVLAYFGLPVNDLPAVDYPVIQVNVGYPGATPETMANNVATPLERQFMQIQIGRASCRERV